jgi:hypothetical protein
MGCSRNARWTLQVPQAIPYKPTWSNQMLVRQSLQLDTGEGVDSMNRVAAFAPRPKEQVVRRLRCWDISQMA